MLDCGPLEFETGEDGAGGDEVEGDEALARDDSGENERERGGGGVFADLNRERREEEGGLLV